MAIAKVILNGETQMDVTQKTVTPASMLSGTTALKNDGTDITGNIVTKTSSDLTTSGATVTAPAGYYASAASKSVASGSAGIPTASKGTVSNHSVSITPSVTNTTGYITGGTKTGTAVTVSASELVSGTKTISASGTTDVTNYESVSVPSGSAKTPATTITANPTVSVNSSGLITATVSKTQSVTPSVSAGYVASGTAGTITVSGSGTNQLTTQAAQTITPSTTDQTIKSGRYLTGDQTILGDANLVPQNIAEGVSIFGVQGSHSGAPKHTATITSDGYYEERSGMKCCAYFNGTRYLTAGETFQFSSGDVASLSISPWNSTTTATSIYVDGVLVSSKVGWQAYEYTLPDNDINIELTTNCVSISITTIVYYNTSNADASPSDVAEGKTFYNAEGYHTGTASGNYGSVLMGIIKRTMSNPTLPEDLTSIGECAFYSFRSLALTSLPNGVTSIGRSAFYECDNLALTSLPSGITNINSYAFYSCYNLALTSLPSGITNINSYAFYSCYNLALTSLPSGVIAIGDDAFNQCISITSLSCDGAIGNLSRGAFQGTYSHPMQLAHVSFPNMQLSSLYDVFGGSTASYACQQLEDADIGSTKAIGANAFANCYKLQTLVLRRSDANCTLSNVSAFLNTPMRGYNGLSGTIYVPSALISTYQTATNWSTIYGEGHVTFAAIEGSEYEL